MNKKTIIISIVGIIFIVAAGLILFFFNREKGVPIEEIEVPELARCAQLININEKDNCYREVAISKRNVLICDKIQTQEIKDWCLGDIAYYYKPNILICDKIKNQEGKDWCYFNIGRVEQNISICEKIQNQEVKDWCYAEIAIFKLDFSICNKIQNQEEKNQCYLDVTRMQEVKN